MMEKVDFSSQEVRLMLASLVSYSHMHWAESKSNCRSRLRKYHKETAEELDDLIEKLMTPIEAAKGVG